MANFDMTSVSLFDQTFNKEISSILLEHLTISEIFLKFNLLNRNFNSIVENLKTYPKLWRIKYLQEFLSAVDKKQKRYRT